eukprot:898928-Amphidinium_carterae.2
MSAWTGAAGPRTSRFASRETSMSAVRLASIAASLAALAALRRAWRDCTRALSTPPTMGSPKPTRMS